MSAITKPPAVFADVAANRLASSNKATLPLMIFWSFVIVDVLAKRRGQALRNPDELHVQSQLMLPITRNARSNLN